MLDEDTFKHNLLREFNCLNYDWIDGDTEDQNSKTADIVNHSFRVAIEIKDDHITLPVSLPTKGYPSGTSYDARKLNKRFTDDMKDANRKFREYEGYKTGLLFRTHLPFAVLVKHSVEGLYTFHRTSTNNPSPMMEYWFISEGLSYLGRNNVRKALEIGCFLVLNDDGYHYFENKYACQNRILTRREVENLTGFTLRPI